MTSVRAAKQKGNCLEYDVQYSLSKTYPQIYRTKERGFQSRVDLIVENPKIAIECKRWASISWNELEKLHTDLVSRFINHECYVIFKSNRQPCLVYSYGVVTTFEKKFGVPFEKHESTRR